MPKATQVDLLLCATREVLAERGFEADITQILSRAGVGAGTIYRRFANKEALLRAVIDEMVSKTLDDLVEVATTVEDAREAIARTMQVGYNRVKEYGLLPIALFAGTEPPEYSDVVDRDALGGLFAALISRGIEQGHFRKDVDIDFAVGIWFSLAAPQALSRLMERRSVEEIARAATDFFLAGISADPPTDW